CLVAAVLMSQFSIARSSNKDVTIEKKKIVVKKIDAKYKKDMIQQVVTVRGLVTDAENSPMAGVSVLVKGSSVATATNQDGRYEIELNKGQTLLFRMIGYADVEFVIQGAGVRNVTMESSQQDIGEVVVIGDGSQQKKDVTGSIATVSMKNVRGQAIISPDQALTGQIAGVEVSTPNVTPGGGPRSQVAGIGAIGAGSQPLYVIDGFPVPASSSERSNPLATINPNDIESMTILKDASATAIYGSRGSNGVVLINTKKGAVGKMKIDV